MPFKVCRGVRESCSLSVMLYSLSIEPLLCKLRAKMEGLEGFKYLGVYVGNETIVQKKTGKE